MRYQVARQGLREGFRPSGGIVTRWMVTASALFLFMAWNVNSALAEDDARYPAEYNAQCKETENTSQTISPQNPYKIDYAVRDAWCLHIEELVNNQSSGDGLAELQELAGLGVERGAQDAKAAFYVGSDAVRTLYQESGTLYNYESEDWTKWGHQFDTKLAEETIGVFEKVLSNIDQEDDPVDKWPRSMFVNPFDLTSHAQIANLSFDIPVSSILVQHDQPKLLPKTELIGSIKAIKGSLAKAIGVAEACKTYESPAEWRAPRRYASNQMKAGCDLIYNTADALFNLELKRSNRVNKCSQSECPIYTDSEKEKELAMINTFIHDQKKPALSSFLNLWDKQTDKFWHPPSP